MNTFKDCPCGKRGWKSHDAALAGNASNGNRLRVYVCHRSGLWHVSKSVGEWKKWGRK